MITYMPSLSVLATFCAAIAVVFCPRLIPFATALGCFAKLDMQSELQHIVYDDGRPDPMELCPVSSVSVSNVRITVEQRVEFSGCDKLFRCTCGAAAILPVSRCQS